MRILAYHAVADLATDPVLAEYGVAPTLFAAQLDDLAGRGWEFVDLDAVLTSLEGGEPLPRRALLLTFDDAYADLLEVACAAAAGSWHPRRRLRRRRSSSAAPITGISRRERQRSSCSTPAACWPSPQRGVEVGSHTATHRSLPENATAVELGAELSGSAAALEGLGLRRPRAFSYPYGGASGQLADGGPSGRLRDRLHHRLGRAPAGRRSLSAVPRVEVHASDTPRKLRLKLAAAGWPRLARDGFLTLAGVRLDPSASCSIARARLNPLARPADVQVCVLVRRT